MFSTQSSGAVNAAVTAVTDVASGAVDAAAGVVNQAANTANNLFQSVNKVANNTVKNISNTMPNFNSILPIGNTNSSANNQNTNLFGNKKNNGNNPTNFSFFGNNKANNVVNNRANNVVNNRANNVVNNRANNVVNNRVNNRVNNQPNIPDQITSWVNPLYVFIGIVLVFLIIFSVFNTQIKTGYEYIVGSIRNLLNMPVNPEVTSAIITTMPEIPVTNPPEPPQDMTPSQETIPQASHKSFVERVLPSTGNEVFNVAQNKFNYYDAEPLCKALGAELATYDQVKEAWGQGADWCNYGWVKGQMAVYPTQNETYDKLQQGPESDRRSCGTVGINGGYFDNPEFKYGVNCYGKKPDQTAHDQARLMAEGKAPKSLDGLKFDQLVNEFKDESDSLFIKPFNDQKWASS